MAGRSSGAGGSTTFSIGGKNVDSTFAGTIANGGDSTAIAKVGTAKLTLTGANTYGGATAISSGTLEIGDGGSSGTLGSGPVMNSATLLFNRSDDFAIANAISGPGTLIKQGAGTLTFDGANTSSGTTRIDEGTLALGPAGAISGPILVAGGATFDVGASLFVLAQTLSGSGTVVGALTAGPSATISPGGPGLPGRLTFSGALTLAGGGAFSAITPDPPGQGLAWDTSRLTVDGTLRVSGSIPVPSIGAIAVNGNLVQITGTGGPPNGSYYVLTSTNVALPAALWASLATNLFGPDGSFAFSHPVDPNAPQQFYLLQNAP